MGQHRYSGLIKLHPCVVDIKNDRKYKQYPIWNRNFIMKEPIQMIEEMYVMMSEMKNQISIIDNNMKLLQAKVNAELFSGIVKANAQASLSNNPPSLQQKPSTELSPPQVTIPPEEPREYKGTMVNGKVLSDDGKP